MKPLYGTLATILFGPVIVLYRNCIGYGTECIGLGRKSTDTKQNADLRQQHVKKGEEDDSLVD